MRPVAMLGLLACTTIACRSTAPALIPPADAIATRFYIVVEGLDGNPEWNTSLALCPVENALFLCHPTLRFMDGSFSDFRTVSTGCVPCRVTRRSAR